MGMGTPTKTLGRTSLIRYDLPSLWQQSMVQVVLYRTAPHLHSQPRLTARTVKCYLLLLLDLKLEDISQIVKPAPY